MRSVLPLRMKISLPLSQRMLLYGLRCRHCNATLPAYASYCGVCGEKLDQSGKVWPLVALLHDIAAVALPLAAVVLWALSLPAVNVGRMTGLGLVSVLPVANIAALVILSLSFCMLLQRQKLQVPFILLHLGLLIFMLYGVTTLVEQAPRFSTVYRHAGYTDYILRHGGVDPYLDAYFNWPGFFILSAFLTRIAGYHDILAYAAWAPVFFNVIYLAPLYVIYTTATTAKRIIWLAVWFFYVTNWIGQDYFSPQGLNFFLYLVILAVLLKWFKRMPAARRRPSPWWGPGWRVSGSGVARRGHMSKAYAWLTAPDALLTPVPPRQRRFLLAAMLLIFAFMVFSHPLTPFFMLASVGALVVSGRCTPRWLPLVMFTMNAAWLIFMAQPYLAGNIAGMLADLGQVGSSVTVNVTGRVAQGSPDHLSIEDIRLVMTLFVWALAVAGAVLRWRGGYRDASLVLLAVIPFPLLFFQTYGGEMLLRIYLFTLPFMVFFAASLFYTGVAAALPARARREASTWSKALWPQLMMAGLCVVMLGGFLFTRYGNEAMDYMTNTEVSAVRHLYATAPAGSLLLAGWDGTPWEFTRYEQYDQEVLGDDVPAAVITSNVPAIVHLIATLKAPRAYVIITRSQRATAQLSGLPPGMLAQLEKALLKSRKFVLIYHNTDAQIFQYSG